MAIPSFITTTTEIVDIGRASCRAGTGSIVIDDGIVGGVSLLLPFGFDSRFDSGEFVIVDRLGNCGGIAGVLFYWKIDHHRVITHTNRIITVLSTNMKKSRNHLLVNVEIFDIALKRTSAQRERGIRNECHISFLD